ncbi:MAG: TIR domain-containing protein [Nitrosopumilaceae archaeon]|nr:toll/interleukin-1 receptor domain-containing protein [Nitrosopumilaceae archaeon]NIU02380.1 toll/interleukin-1 receptor domain-containing protein [Nitrosopumilaceae archaeon]NIU88837.1 TIR domain-containing protein [Nitrosopumilaceae archaeon]NIV66961.1 TIR domain-containing protein [Nitrosopumilaceae archaeon]NIX62981.1 TIR domain-containing protein [Nitrosopumilaceae archaeon]
MVEITREEWDKIKESDFVAKSLRLFLSYSSKDRRIAGKIKNSLEQFQIRVFLAHEDITPTQEWEEEILHNLNNCDIFCPLLTKNFVRSEWTSQELGIAFCKQKFILPLKLDVDPYGFINKIQALKINEDVIDDSVKRIIEIINRDKILRDSLRDCVIQSLEKVNDFDSGAKRLAILEIFEFNNVQITEIFRKAIIDNQIRMSRKGKRQLRKWLEEYSDKIDPFVKNLFEKVRDEFFITISE